MPLIPGLISLYKHMHAGIFLYGKKGESHLAFQQVRSQKKEVHVNTETGNLKANHGASALELSLKLLESGLFSWIISQRVMKDPVLL